MSRSISNFKMNTVVLIPLPFRQVWERGELTNYSSVEQKYFSGSACDHLKNWKAKQNCAILQQNTSS